MSAHDLDELYRTPPAEFTAVRGRLVKAARSRGETDEAKRLAAARKPTTAAWVVNALTHRDPEVVERLGDLGEQLRAAHATMAGDRIRELSAEQRRLVAKLTDAAFAAAALAKPSAAVRDDVTATLHAAIADPDVRSRLGRLIRAERWSGFGGFGESAAVSAVPNSADPADTAAQKADAASASVTEKPAPGRGETERHETERHETERRRAEARAALAEAERVRADADRTLGERRADLATARLAHDDARARLDKARDRLQAAEDAYAAATAAHRDAAEQVRSARARMTNLR